MRIELKEEFALSVQGLFGYFKSPVNWPCLYGVFGSDNATAYMRRWCPASVQASK